MKRAPIFPKDENGKPNELGYDPQIDFSKFLEEARKHANDVKLESTPHSYDYEKTSVAATHKSKRSWKDTLFFWKKFAKKEGDSHDRMPSKSSNGFNSSNRRNVPVSGPMPRTGISGHPISRRPSSGPLGGWFTPTKAEESEIPYRSLELQSHTSGVKAFGPIYRVT